MIILDWTCNGCNESRAGEVSYCCRTCDFDLCVGCVSKTYGFTPASVAPPSGNGVKMKALFVGINYPGTNAELKGCVNDVRNMIRMLGLLGYGFTEQRILVDDRSFPNVTGPPTRRNIEDGLRWLVSGAKAGDNLFFHYSGHGANMSHDGSGPHREDKDETLVPGDYETSGQIRDGWIYENVCARVPAGCRLTAITDCCHSGTVLDLPMQFVGNSWKTLAGPIAGDILHISGCEDEQTSADVSTVNTFYVRSLNLPKGAGGACTTTLMSIMQLENADLRTLTYAQVYDRMRRLLTEKRFSQRPQLCASRGIDLNRPFSFSGTL